MEALDVKYITVASEWKVVDYIFNHLSHICFIKFITPVLEGPSRVHTGKYRLRIRLHYREGQRNAKKVYAEAEAEAKRALNIN